MSPSRLDRLAELEKKIDNNIRKKKSTKQKRKENEYHHHIESKI